MRKFSLALLTPVISLPVMVTRSTCPASTDAMNSLKLNGLWLVWNLVENCQTRAPMTTRTIQNTRLFKVEFKLGPHHVSDLRVSPYSAPCVQRSLWY